MEGLESSDAGADAAARSETAASSAAAAGGGAARLTQYEMQMQYRMLKTVPLFASLSDADLRPLLAAVQPAAFSAGEYLLRQGDIGDTMYFVTEGEVWVWVGSTDAPSTAPPRLVKRCLPGDYVGESAMAGAHRRMGSAQASDNGTVRCLTLARDMYQHMCSDPTSSPALCSALYSMLRKAKQLRHSIALPSLPPTTAPARSPKDEAGGEEDARADLDICDADGASAGDTGGSAHDGSEGAADAGTAEAWGWGPVDRGQTEGIVKRISKKYRTQIVVDGLRESRHLSNVPHEQLHRLADACDVVEFKDGELALEQGSTGDFMYFVVNGELSLVVRSDSGESAHERLVKRCKKGDYTGEAGLVSGAPRTAGAVAQGDTLCLRISRAQLAAVYNELPPTTELVVALRGLVAQVRSSLQRRGVPVLPAPRAGPSSSVPVAASGDGALADASAYNELVMEKTRLLRTKAQLEEQLRCVLRQPAAARRPDRGRALASQR